MDRSREARKVSMASPASMSRRRHRGSGLRDSPDEDGPVEQQETARLRDRKKERERERDRDRERLSRNKRRKGDRLMHAGNREEGPEESTDESVNDDDEEEYEEDGGGSLRMPPPNPASTSSPSLSNHHHNHNRRSFPQSNPARKMFRPASPWKPADEMIGVPVPRKARSASTKRAHDYWVSGSGGILGGDHMHRQASTSPARSSLVSATASPSRISPSSSNISIRKKMKPIAANKHRIPPKASSSKAATSNPDEIEFEIAEVLYGLMRQPPGSSKPESGPNEALNKSAIDSKSRVSSPVTAAVMNQPSSLHPQNAATSAIVATAPKRKRPRPVNYSDENVASHSQANIITEPDVEQTAKVEIMSPNLEKNFKPVLAIERISPDLEQSRSDSASKRNADVMKLVRNTSPGSESLRPEPVGHKDEDGSSKKEESPGSRLGENREDHSKSTVAGLGIKLEEKFQIDLMAPPPVFKLSPESDRKIECVLAEPKKPIPDLEELKLMVKDAEKTKLTSNGSIDFVEPDQKRFKRGVVEESEVQKASFSNEVFNTEKNDGENGKAINGANRQQGHKQQQAQSHLPRAPTGDEATGDKSVLAASSLPSAMSMAAWQGGLPPMGYMTPLQGVVSMDGSSGPIQPPQVLLNQPRPKRCATHCYIAQNITYQQQFTRMNPFWPAAAGSAPTLYGAKPCNLNVVPPLELHGCTGVRGVNPVQDKSLGVFNGSSTSKDKPSQGPNNADTAQRKQILLQQSVPAGPSSNLMRGPAFIFPLNQQQAAVAASALTTTTKNPLVAGAGPVGNHNSGAGSAPSSAPATLSFNYPNMAANETQYLAILQNNPYQFPFPTHAGAPPVYRGPHPQAMPFFNGPFYSPQMLPPPQIQQPQLSAHGHQIPPGQNTGLSGGSSSSQKHLQNHPVKSQGNGSGAWTANMKQSFPSPKNRPSQLPLQQQNQHLTEVGSEDSPSTADSRGSRSNLNMYTEGLNLPIHAQNFALMSATSISVSGANGITNGNHQKTGNHSEKKLAQQHQGLKVGVDSLPSHQGFAVSFSSLNGGGPPALDIASMGQNHAILHNFPDAARRSYPIMAAAVPQSHQKKNFRIPDEGKKGSSGEASNVEEERKSLVSKGGLSNVGLSIAFSRSDLADSSVPVNSVVDSSSRNLKVGSGPDRTSGPVLSSSLNNANSLNFQQQQLQPQQQQKPQLIHLHKQHQQYMAAAARGKTPSMSNGNVYTDHLPTNAAMAAKLTNSLSAFQQSHAPISGGSSSPTQSPQWKNSARTSISQVQSPALTSSNAGSVKNHYQQQSQLSQQSHMQISFGGGNQKSLTAAQGQQLPTGHQGLSQTMVGSPVPSSNYKSSGSPRTITAGMATNKAPQGSTLSPSASLQVKNSPMPSRSSSPVGARNVPSALGNSNMGMPQGNSGSKPQQLQQQQLQQQMKPQLTKQGMQQAQFPSYLQTSQGPNSSNSATSLTAANSGYLQRRRPETQPQQQSPSPSGPSSTGMLSMCSSTNAVTSDPAKAIAAAAAAVNSIKAPPLHVTGNTAAAQPSGQPHHLPTSFPYMHVVPAVGQGKPAQQKQGTGE
uniref:Time for coffee n=1 Tax=Kalanchoe fedtschenkoi TaxID=63787 RepID=A0A7N0TXD8_KALFE